MADWIVFDFDGTLSTHRSGWTVLHALFGTEHVQPERAVAYRDGELTFEEWADRDVEDWMARGATKDDVHRAARAVKLAEGAPATLSRIDDLGYRFGVLSGGLADLATVVEPYAPAFVHANRLEFDDDGRLRGVETRVDPAGKDEALRQLGAEYGFRPDEVVFVGDSRSDLEAWEAAGTAVLFDPDPSLEEDAYDVPDVVLRTNDLTALLGHV